jgi:hypothetical protein
MAASHYDGTHDRWVPLPGPENGARYPADHELDARATRAFAFRRWAIEVALEAGYVPVRSAQLYPVWNYDWTEQRWVTGPVFLPLLSARARL